MNDDWRLQVDFYDPGHATTQDRCGGGGRARGADGGGAADEDDANVLAQRMREEAPPSSKVAVEGTWSEAYAERPPNPFAVLGGLGS